MNRVRSKGGSTWRLVMTTLTLTLAIAGGLVAAPAAQTVAQEATATTGAGVSGTSYASPTYGYTLSWDSSWRALSAISVSGEDILVLSNGTSTLIFDGGVADSGDAARCLQDAVQKLKADPTNQQVSLANGTNGQPIQGHTATTAYAVYTYQHHDGTAVPYATYIKCETLVPGQAVLTIDETVPAANFNTQIGLVQQLIAHLTLAPAGQGTLASGTATATVQTGTTAANKALIQRWYSEVIEQNNPAAADSFLAANVVGHYAPPEAPAVGRATYEANLRQDLAVLIKAFPDIKFTVNDIRADGDEVIARTTATGTQTGAFESLPPTGKTVTIEEIDIFRIANGQITDIWSLVNDVGILQQLGVLPTATATTGG